MLDKYLYYNDILSLGGGRDTALPNLLTPHGGEIVKRLLLVAFSLMMVASMVLAGCTAPTAAKVRVATDATWPPFESVDEATKELTGFDIELMKAVADKAGFEIEWVNTPFDTVITGVTQCDYDLAIAAITITEERKAEMLFSDPYLPAGQIVVIRKETTDIKGVADLVGKTVAAQLGTTGEIEAQKIEGITYKPYDTVDLAFLDLSNGQVDAVIADYPTALAFIGQNPDKLTLTGDVFTNEYYGIAACKTQTALIEKINAALKELTDAKVLYDLEQKYLAGQ